MFTYTCTYIYTHARLKLAMPEGFLLPDALESFLSDKLLNM